MSENKEIIREDIPLDPQRQNRVNKGIEEDQVFFSFTESSPTVEIHGNLNEDYIVQFYNYETNELIKETRCKSRHKVSVDIRYFIPWRFVISNSISGDVLKDYTLRFEGKNILVTYESSALGDTIAWMPYLEEFRKKHKCNIICSSFHNDLFSKLYPNITFIQRGQPLQGIHMRYMLGWFGSGHASNKNPNDCHTIPLQKVATDILGLEYEEIRAEIPHYKATKKEKMRLDLPSKYVVITTCSTAQFKYWNRPFAWQELVDWYNKRGYKVVNIGKQPSSLKGVVNRSGKLDFNLLKYIIQEAEYFVGLPSGLAWLAWALNKKSVMITGISEAYCEYRLDNYRAENLNACHGCFNNPKHTFDKGDWLYCPEHKNTEKHFECTKTITPEMVQKICLKLESDIKTGSEFFSMSDDECFEYLESIGQ